MCRRTGIILLAIFAAILSFGNSGSFAAGTSPVSAEIKSHFDLPAEPLDKALRDFAVQANCNISYEPSIVAGLRSPAIKGEFTVGSALSLILTGTKLRAVNVDGNTIQILENPQPSKESKSTDLGVGDSVTAESKARENRELDEIVVTGSHIRGISVASPVIEIGREEIDRSGYTSIADLMLSLPQNFGGGYSAATAVNNTTVNPYSDNPTGATVPDLRGLGPGSTLTLIDGHRMASGLTGGGADIASIPLDAIERVEVVTDSASAIYGSDAVAGVVNIILKKDYDGANTSLSYGVATDGGGTERRASQLLGTNWSGGNVLFSYEHAQQDAVDAGQREFTSSALMPNSLLPRTRSNAITLSVSQDISTIATGFLDALYIVRDANHFATSPYGMGPAEDPSTLRKYAVAAGLNFNLPHDWKATLAVDVAEDATNQTSTYLTKPSPTPGPAEELLGTMRNIELSANGEVASLPSGAVRLAAGAGYRKEGFSDALGLTAASLSSVAEGYRNIRYAFGELSVPLAAHSPRPGLNSFDLTVSGRSERYSDFGSTTVPKIGLVYAPASSVKLRSTWGKAFRAPNLFDTDGVQQLVILDLPNPVSPAGHSPALLRAGGNPDLQPETAESWTVGADFAAPDITGIRASATLFDIKYTNRISSIANAFAALTDPQSEFFVTPSPSPTLVQSVYGGYPSSQIFNFSGAPYDPNTVGAIVETRMVNVARQTARGADLNLSYEIGGAIRSGLLFLNGTYLDLNQQNTPQSSEQTLSGLAFYPAKFRARGGASWKLNSWVVTSTMNFLPSETNNQVMPYQRVGSWATVDASVRYAPKLPGVLSGLRVSLAALNIFNRNPPFVQLPPIVNQGFNYDSANTTPLGRFVNLHISKEW